MKKGLFTLLLITDAAIGADISLGTSICSSEFTDYCPRGILGKIEVGHDFKKELKGWRAEISHSSKLGDGEWKLDGDKGVTFLNVEYKWKLN